MTNIERATILVVAVALAGWLGHLHGWSRCEREQEAEWATSLVLDRCVDAGFVAMALDQLPAEGSDKARKILVLRLEQELADAERLMPSSGLGAGAIPVAVPNAAESLRRAESWCRGNGRADLADRTASLLRTLQP